MLLIVCMCVLGGGNTVSSVSLCALILLLYHEHQMKYLSFHLALCQNQSGCLTQSKPNFFHESKTKNMVLVVTFTSFWCLQNSLHLNVAACYHKLGECKKSIEACNKVWLSSLVMYSLSIVWYFLSAIGIFYWLLCNLNPFKDFTLLVKIKVEN